MTIDIFRKRDACGITVVDDVPSLSLDDVSEFRTNGLKMWGYSNNEPFIIKIDSINYEYRIH